VLQLPVDGVHVVARVHAVDLQVPPLGAVVVAGGRDLLQADVVAPGAVRLNDVGIGRRRSERDGGAGGRGRVDETALPSGHVSLLWNRCISMMLAHAGTAGKTPGAGRYVPGSGPAFAWKIYAANRPPLAGRTFPVAGPETRIA